MHKGKFQAADTHKHKRIHTYKQVMCMHVYMHIYLLAEVLLHASDEEDNMNCGIKRSCVQGVNYVTFLLLLFFKSKLNI